MERKKTNLKLMWDNLMKQVDLEEPTPLLDQVFLGCTQRECKPTLTQATSRLAESCEIVRTTISHRISVVSFEDQKHLWVHASKEETSC